MRPEHRRICENIALKVKEKGGRAYYVGGCVRDELMGRASLDTDIEIHGIPEEELEELEEAAALKNTAKMPARIKCAMLGWRTLETMLDGGV